jgi:hypothetical protein
MIDLGYWEGIRIALDDEAWMFFPGYDIEIDLALEALGDKASRPILMLELFKHRPTDALLRIFPINPKVLCKIAVKWSESNALFEPPKDDQFFKVYKDENLDQWSKHFLDLARRTCAPQSTMGQVVMPGKLALAKHECEKLAVWLRRSANSPDDDEFMPEWMCEAMSAFHALLGLAEIAEDENCERFILCEEDAARTIKDVFWIMYESETLRYSENVADAKMDERILSMAKILVAANR